MPKLTLNRWHKVVQRLNDLLQQQQEIIMRDLGIVRMDPVSANAARETLIKRQGPALVRLTEAQNILKAIEQIKTAVAAANVANGVHGMLAAQDRLQRELVFKKQLLKQQDAPGMVNVSQLPVAEPVETGYTRHQVEVGLFPAEGQALLAAEITQLQQHLYQLTDQLADANQTKVAIPLDDRLIDLIGLGDRG